MKNKKLIIIITVVILFMIIGAIHTPLRRAVPVKLPTPSPAQNIGEAIGSSENTFSVPDNNKLIISGVTVNNFYNTALNRSGGNVVFYEHDSIQFAYVYDINIFTISIQSVPFETLRQEAEKKFSEVLGINQQEACKLNVQVQTAPYVDYEHSLQVYGLSFCD